MNEAAYKGWLKPSILLCVWDNGGSRGHELAERLVELGFGDVKLKRIYSTLQRMEAAGLVAPDNEYVDRPAWRRYGITASGERHLEFWARSFEAYRKEMDYFLHLYRGELKGQKSQHGPPFVLQ